MSRSARLLLVTLVLLASVGCDQASKRLARNALDGATAVSLLAGSIHLELVENRGGFLSLGEALPLGARRLLFGFAVPALLAVVALAAVMARELRRTQVIGLALLLGGGTGNLIDRFSFDGAVTDFVRVSLGPLTTGVFNLSDLAITLGALAFACARGRDATLAPAGAGVDDGSDEP